MSEGYRLPSPAIAAVVDAPPTPEGSVAPGGARMLGIELPGLPPIAELAQPELHLAGLRLNPRTNGPSRAPYDTGLTVQPIAGGEPIPVRGLPAEARIGHVTWSPDGAAVAFSLTRDDGIELWAADTATGHARRLT